MASHILSLSARSSIRLAGGVGVFVRTVDISAEKYGLRKSWVGVAIYGKCRVVRGFVWVLFSLFSSVLGMIILVIYTLFFKRNISDPDRAPCFLRF